MSKILLQIEDLRPFFIALVEHCMLLTMQSSSTLPKKSSSRGWRAVLGCTPEALAIFRISLGVLLVCELVLRFRFLHVFYTDEGTMPLRLLLPKIDDLYKSVCLHCHFGELWQQQLLLGFQTIAAILLTVGYQTKIMSIISFYMYTSLILRNTWLYFILDRYFYYLLFYSMFLPLDERWSLSSRSGKKTANRLIVNPGTVRMSIHYISQILSKLPSKLILFPFIFSIVIYDNRLESNYWCSGFT